VASASQVHRTGRAPTLILQGLASPVRYRLLCQGARPKGRPEEAGGRPAAGPAAAPLALGPDSMVLLQKKLWQPEPLPTGYDDSLDVWWLPTTREAFLRYTDYLERLRIVRSRIWSSLSSGKTNLTFEEAAHEDEQGRLLAQQVIAS